MIPWETSCAGRSLGVLSPEPLVLDDPLWWTTTFSLRIVSERFLLLLVRNLWL
jgi:hypothetical protein